MNIKKFINLLGKYWKNLVSFGTGLLVLLGIVDYFTKWGIFSFLFSFFSKIWFKVNLYLNILFLLWLLVLTILIVRQSLKKKEESPGVNGVITPQTIKTLEERFKKFIDSELKTKLSIINSKFDRINDELFEIKRKDVAFSIKSALAEGRASISLMIGLLEIDINKNWEWRIHRTLKMIRDRLRKHKIASEDCAKLIKQLDRLEAEYEKIKKEIKDLIVIA